MKAMWGNLFGGVLAPPPPDPSPESVKASTGKVFSLGEELPAHLDNNFGAPADGAIRSDLPPGVKSAQAADKVRAVTNKQIQAAWKSLQDEFGVQKLVWQSVQVSRKNEKSSLTDHVSSLFEKALGLKQKDPDAALKLVEEARAAGQNSDLLNKGVEQACSSVLKANRPGTIQSRKQLAQRLDMAANPAHLPKTEAARVQLRLLVDESELDDAKLEKSVRKILDLLPPEDMAPANGAKRSSGYGAPVNGKKNSKLSEKGTPVSKKTSSRTRSLGAPAAGSKMSSLLRQLPPPLTQTTNYEPFPSDMPLETKTQKCAERVRSLASQKINESWDNFKTEFGVQKLVWESRALLKQVDPKEISSLSSTIERALNGRTTDPSGALRVLHPILESSDKNDVISNSMAKAMRDVMKQANLITDRSRLAERLSTASVPATLPRGDAQKRELEALVVACELDDMKFEVVVRKILLLAPPQFNDGPGSPVTGPKHSSPVGSPATGAKKSSGFTGTAASKKTMSAPRSASTGAMRSKATKPVKERIREDHEYLAFRPADRTGGKMEL